MLVKTASGSQYFFTDKDNQTFFIKGLMEGVVKSLEGLEVGHRLKISFYQLNPYTYEPQGDVSIIITSPITEIVY